MAQKIPPSGQNVGCAIGVAAGDGVGGELDGRICVRAAEMATRRFALPSPEAAIRPVRERARPSTL